ncbi:aminopeptidase [Alicyclobacillus fastidiosus]|uniref:Aminopeptidase n=1 Tax=Alicyclobacillus fastidiosus TaxID=392011 RepID=A0ABY6ZGF0_9BACL|nr:aminopeptidase [Alicyclobacillus fastidiosus]WAH41922.1 aminopeptidase [Alicyclobacillus fastidiosus]GMA63641.1 aminopeptidase [Alicyclobacillus fastidiosus]
MPNEEQLVRYADVLIQVGLNVQPGQPVSINAPIEAADFVRVLVTRCYHAGASTVSIDWYDPLCKRIRLEQEPEAGLQDVPSWVSQKMLEECQKNTAFLHIDAEDPDLLAGVDPRRISLQSKARRAALRETDPYFMEDRVTWLVCSIPTTAWAMKLFPGESAETAVANLWDTIFSVMRMHEPDPVVAWREHLEKLRERAAYLNEQHFVKLHYRGPGTDLTVELPELHQWLAASAKNDQGHAFVPNMPTEEVFTLPKRDGVNGTLRSTMPLAYEGVVIEGLELTFENGRIVNFNAESGYETMKELIATDEGSHYLGEIALVPVDSPISRCNTLFYNTLFDENASCHVAIGEAYPVCLAGGVDMPKEELKARGANESLMHVDFMIGSPALDIDGYLADGTVVPLFRGGNWAV